MSGAQPAPHIKIASDKHADYIASRIAESLKSGGGGPIFPGMDADIAVLKYRADQTDARFEQIDQKLDKLIERTNDLPTKRDLWAWKWQWTALSVGTIAVVVGGIIGGLSWIKPDAPNAPTAAPTVINVQPAPVTILPAPAPQAPQAPTRP